MVFSSLIFIFGFLPAFFAIYHLAKPQHRSYVIVAGSYVFYAWWRLDFAFLLFAVTSWTYLIGNRLAGTGEISSRKRILALSVTVNLAVLGYFKYCNFFIDSLEALLNGGEAFSWIWGQVILPVGISFYIFQSISYLVDLYRGSAEPPRRFIDFCAFNALFPQLIAGPVLRYKDLAHQFEHREHSWSQFNHGSMRFLMGLSKKVLIADSVAPLADAMFSLPEPTFIEAWLGAVAFSVQLYFDFSGYSSMAIGLGLMMGFSFPENFNSPYRSQSITQFWRRWHISLSTWLRDYLYIPLGGNRRGAARTYRNLLLTMVLGGLWHGANWTFIIWGAWHGAIMAIERGLGISAHTKFRFLSWMLTIVLVMIGWVVFRSQNVGHAAEMLTGMVGLNAFAMRPDTFWQIKNSAVSILVLGAFLSVCEPWLRTCFYLKSDRAVPVRSDVTSGIAVATLVLGALSILKLAADSDTPFLYFQF